MCRRSEGVRCKSEFVLELIEMNIPPLTEQMMLQVMVGAWAVLFFVFFLVPGSPKFI